MAKYHLYLSLKWTVSDLVPVRIISNGWRVADLPITSLTAEVNRRFFFINLKEPSMISFRPDCPHAQKLPSGTEFSLDDESIIFRNAYNPVFLGTLFKVSVGTKEEAGMT